jgi:3-oxoacyl-[acyl-carrier-protein] synthase-3
LEKANLTIDQINFMIPHQANKFVLERLRAKLKFPAERFWIDMENSGNTVSSTIPIALEGAINQGRVKSGDRVALVGFGVGYSWGATLIEIV